MSLIIDTDIGSDVDDALALAYALKSGLDVKLITTVHGPVRTRAHLAKKICLLLGQDIPVACGESLPIKQKQIFSTGMEETNLEKGEEYPILENAVDALIQTARKEKEVSVAAIGPLTNLAKALEKDPGLAKNIRHFYLMGNAIIAPENFYLNYRAHNFKVDPEAADIVLASGVPLTIITTEVCKQNYFTKEELEKMKGTPLLDYLGRSAKRWIDFINYEQAYLYDPLVIEHYRNDSVTEKVAYGTLSRPVKITKSADVSFKNRCLETLLR